MRVFSAVSKMKRGSDQVNPTPSEGKNRPPLKNVTNLSNSGKLQPPNEKETRKIVTRSATTHISVAVEEEEKTLFSHKTAAQNKGAVKKSTIAGQCTQTNSKPATFTGSSLLSCCALDESKPFINKLSSRSTEVNSADDLSTTLIRNNESTVFKSLRTYTPYYVSGKKKVNFRRKLASTPIFIPVSMETVIIDFYKKGYTNPYITNKYGEVNIHPDFYKACYLPTNMQLPHINFRPQYDKNHPFKNVRPIFPNELTPLATIIHRSSSRDSLELSVKLKKKYESQSYTLDIFSKEYDGDIMEYLLNTEDRYTLEETKLNGLNILDVRCKIISWLYKVKFYYVQETSIILKTIKLYDWVVAHEIIPYNMHELIVMTILMIVQKMDNSRTCDQSFTISQISTLCLCVFDSDTINSMEEKLLHLFNYKVNVPEPATFLGYLCHTLQLEPIVLSTAELVLEIFSTNKMFSCISPFLAAITALNLILRAFPTNFYKQSWSHVLSTFPFISNSQMDFVGNIMREEIKKNCYFSINKKNMKDTTLFVLHQDITNSEIIKALYSLF